MSRTLSCADLLRILAFSQLTWRESLRDIEVCLAANQTKLFHMGLAQPPARSTLADALNLRDWRIYQALALRLISRARALYAEDSVLDIDATIYQLDAIIVDLCLSLFGRSTSTNILSKYAAFPSGIPTSAYYQLATAQEKLHKPRRMRLKTD